MIKLGKLISEIGSSVQLAQNNMRECGTDAFLNYFDVEEQKDFSSILNSMRDGEDGISPAKIQVFSPKLLKFNMTKTEDGKLLDVPSVSLAQHGTIALDSVQVTMNVSAAVEKGEFLVNVESANTPGVPLHQVVLNFKSSAPPEGASRILDCTNQFV